MIHFHNLLHYCFYVTSQIQFPVQIRPRLLIACLNSALFFLISLLLLFVQNLGENAMSIIWISTSWLQLYVSCYELMSAGECFILNKRALELRFQLFILMLKKVIQWEGILTIFITSPELKARFYDRLSSVVHLSVWPSVHKLFTSLSSSPEHHGQFKPNLTQSILGLRD